MALGCRRPPVDDQEFPVRYCLVAGCRCVTSCMLPQSACVGGVRYHDGLHVFAGASSGGANMPGIPPRCYVLFYAIGLAALFTQTAAYSPPVAAQQPVVKQPTVIWQEGFEGPQPVPFALPHHCLAPSQCQAGVGLVCGYHGRTGGAWRSQLQDRRDLWPEAITPTGLPRWTFPSVTP